MTGEFEEIGHSGGKITFKIGTGPEGGRGFQTEFTSSRPVPTVMIAGYALPQQGVAVDMIQLGGIGQPWNPPPFPGCIPVFIASDSQGQFGHHCPRCKGYWRSGPWPNICPYCAFKSRGHQFLSEAQRRYVRHYCEVLGDGLGAEEDKDIVIDMDAVADAVGREGEKPPFYVSEQSQQRKFTCTECDEFNDILGRFGYCSRCGTRNDLADFEGQTLPGIRDRLKSGGVPEDCLRDAVAAFDSLVAQYAKQLAALVPLTERRRGRLLRQRFHNLEELRDAFRNWFDIDVCAGMKEGDYRFASMKFHRRHVYEHNGGEVDQKYIEDSGDKTVRLKQHIHEAQEDLHRLLGLLLKMATNLHDGFHELFPPKPEPIKELKDKKAWIAKHR